jgi:amino acid transporter
VALLLILKTLKLMAVIMFAAGLAGAHGEGDIAARKRWAVRWAAPGLLAVVVLGAAMAGLQGVSLLATWIVLSLGAGLLALHFAMWSTSRPERSARRHAVGSLIALLCAVASMVWKPT